MSGAETAVLVVLAAVVVVRIAGPVLAAVGELLHVLMIVVVAFLGLAGTGLVALLA